MRVIYFFNQELLLLLQILRKCPCVKIYCLSVIRNYLNLVFPFFSIKILILRFFRTLSFLNSNGIIFLSNFSKDIISKRINLKKINTIIIPHGVDKSFYFKPKVQFEVDKYNHIRPFKFLYVSDLWPYKNHENFAKTICDPVTNLIIPQLKNQHLYIIILMICIYLRNAIIF